MHRTFGHPVMVPPGNSARMISPGDMRNRVHATGRDHCARE